MVTSADGSSSDKRLKIYLLGQFRILYQHQPVPGFHANRLQALLASLLLDHGSPISRQQLSSRLWPDSNEGQARTNLRHLLHTLRLALPEAENFLYLTPDQVGWNTQVPVWVDVIEFEKFCQPGGSFELLRQGVEHYQGDLLPDCYEDWIVPYRHRLREQFLSALVEMINQQTARGDVNGAIQTTNRLLQQDPLRETTYCRLMELYARLGDRASVVRTFDACVAILEKELGVEPGPESYAVLDALLQAKENLGKSGHTPASAPLKVKGLPAPLDILIGRQEEKRQLIHMLHSHRLVTLTGFGGVGKTRLAQETAWELARSDDSSLAVDGIWWIDLAPISTQETLTQTVAAVVQIIMQASRPVMDDLLDWIGTKQIILVLDNCEHLLEITSQFIFTLLQGCPNLRVMATSRISLHQTGEAALYVPPLSTQSSEPAELSESELLFCERARAANPTFTLRREYREAVRMICTRLDGIPLAIELAAARTRILTPPEIADRLENVFQLLVQKKHGALPRHQTLRSTLDWSYQLLSKNEAYIFRCLSVFHGGFTQDSAVAVCGRSSATENEILNDLEALIDKSLLRPVVFTDRQPRNMILEMVREYAHDRLSEAGEADEVHHRHAMFYLSLANRAEPLLESPQQATWLDLLEVELPNLRSALTWMRETGDIENGLRLSTASALFFFMRGYLREGSGWLVHFLSFPSGPDIVLRAKACDRAGLLARYQGAYEQAQYWITESLSIRRRMNDLKGIADSLDNIGYVALHQGNDALALQYYREALDFHQQLGNPQGIADSYSHLAKLAFKSGNFREAETLHQTSLDIWRELEDKQGIGWALYYLGEVSLTMGELARSRSLFRESLEISEAIGFKWGIAHAIEGLACYAAEIGQPALAIKMAGGAAYLREMAGLPVSSDNEMILKRLLAHARDAIGENRAAAENLEGLNLHVDQLIQMAYQT